MNERKDGRGAPARATRRGSDLRVIFVRACQFLVATAFLGAALAAAPAAPANLAATVAGDRVTLTWNAPPGVVTAYRLQAGTAPGLANLANALVPATPALTVAGVAPGTYYVRVRAVAADGESPPSNEIVIRVGGASQNCSAPPGPPALTATVSGSQLALSWTPSGCAAAQYVVHAGSTPGASDIGVAPVGAVTSMTAAVRHGVYHLRVVATNAFGSASSNPASVEVRDGAPLAAASGAGRGVLRVMTWNIHHGKSAAGVYDVVSQARFIASQNADVIALQEVQTWDENQPVRYRQLLEQFTGQPWAAQWAPVNNRAGTEGNLVLTRLPVVSSSSHQMHATGDWNALYSNRSAARIAVSVGGVPVHVFSTHLDAYNSTHRTAQLLDFMHWSQQFGARRIAAGDFNSTPGQYWTMTMLGDYTDTWQDVTGSASGGATINGGRIDYLFRARQGAESLRPLGIRVVPTHLSDHAAVIADYAVVP